MHSTSVFAHSTVTGINVSKLPSFEESRNDRGRDSPVVITVIWKKGELMNIDLKKSDCTW